MGGQKFRLNPNDELGISGINKNSTISNLEFRHSKYNSSELLLDLALLTSGTGSLVMIGHLVDLLVLTSAASLKGKKHNTISELVNQNKTIRDALAEASPGITSKFKKGDSLTPKELKQMVENHLDRHVKIEAINDLEFKPGFPTGIKAIVTEESKTESIKETDNTDIKTITDKSRGKTKEARSGNAKGINEAEEKKVSIKL